MNRLSEDRLHSSASATLEVMQTYPIGGGDAARAIREAAARKVVEWCKVNNRPDRRAFYFSVIYRYLRREFCISEYRLLPMVRLDEALKLINNLPNPDFVLDINGGKA